MPDSGLFPDSSLQGSRLQQPAALVAEYTLDGEYGIQITNMANEHDTFSSDFNYSYLDIEVREDDGYENEYEVSMPCEIIITYSPIRKVGV